MAERWVSDWSCLLRRGKSNGELSRTRTPNEVDFCLGSGPDVSQGLPVLAGFLAENFRP